MPYKDKTKQNKFNLDRMQRTRAEWFKDKSCWKCGATENVELEWLGTGEKNHRIWSWSPEKREEILKNYRVACRHHRIRGNEHVLTPEQVQLIREATINGYGRKSAGKLLGHCQRTIERYLERMDIPNTQCACGREARHRSMCWWRLRLDQMGLAEETKEELRQWQRARAFLNKTKEQLRTKIRGQYRPKSQDEGLRPAPTSQTL